MSGEDKYEKPDFEKRKIIGSYVIRCQDCGALFSSSDLRIKRCPYCAHILETYNMKVDDAKTSLLEMYLSLAASNTEDRKIKEMEQQLLFKLPDNLKVHLPVGELFVVHGILVRKGKGNEFEYLADIYEYPHSEEDITYE